MPPLSSIAVPFSVGHGTEYFAVHGAPLCAVPGPRQFLLCVELGLAAGLTSPDTRWHSKKKKKEKQRWIYKKNKVALNLANIYQSIYKWPIG